MLSLTFLKVLQRKGCFQALPVTQFPGKTALIPLPSLLSNTFPRAPQLFPNLPRISHAGGGDAGQSQTRMVGIPEQRAVSDAAPHLHGCETAELHPQGFPPLPSPGETQQRA